MPGRASSLFRLVRKQQAFGRGGNTTIPRKTPGRQKAGTPDRERSAAHPSQQFDVSIYCDSACDPNPGNAGSGIVVYRSGKLAQLWFGLYNPMGPTTPPN